MSETGWDQLTVCGGDQPSVMDSSGRVVARCLTDIEARRIVALWNAMVDFPTETLESIGVVLSAAYDQGLAEGDEEEASDDE